MTGISANQVAGKPLTPGLLGLLDENDVIISDMECPLVCCLKSRATVQGEFRLVGCSGREVKVELTFNPVQDALGQVHGAIVLIHDASIQIDLQRQLKDLHAFSSLDSLTQVANRAEFERKLDQFVRNRNNSDFECSVIVCDIDFFKQINDNYNHHIGDQALIAFAALLKKFVRNQDVVARYGGEEFVILCANCDVDAAVERAEEIRVALTQTPQSMLDNKCITASFGVSQLHANESSTDFFVRADTALHSAKELGRNRVVQACNGQLGEETKLKSVEITSLSGVSWRKHTETPLVNEEHATNTPLSVIVEKLRGYIIECEAEIQEIDSNFTSLIVETRDKANISRKGKFFVDIEFQERETDQARNIKTSFIRISVREAKRSWFSANCTELAPSVVNELRRYLMLNDASSKLKLAPAATKPGKR
jgi:diguanylate cyclase (GGDEF)-like protein